MSEWTEETIVVCAPVTLEYDPSRVGREYLVAEAERGLTNALQHIAGHYRIEGGEATVSERHWIPVVERLPEAGVYVLMFLGTICSVGMLDDDGDWFGCGPCGPTHWMPLPEPPEVTP